jgi:hypothetical protein
MTKEEWIIDRRARRLRSVAYLAVTLAGCLAAILMVHP